jgi:hypothetical protein
MHDNYLIHYGIKGQIHGIRRFQNEDGTLTEEGKRRYGYYDREDGSKDYKRLQKDAANDAKEYARAKAFYGEGAGIRRKQIKNKISERMKDTDYKKEFERLLKMQDMSAHQKAANRERKVRDVKNTTVRTARGVKNFLLGNAVPMTTAALAIGATLKYTGAGAKIASYGRTSFSKVMSWLSKNRNMSGSYGRGMSAFSSFMGGR